MKRQSTMLQAFANAKITKTAPHKLVDQIAIRVKSGKIGMVDMLPQRKQVEQ